MLLQVLNNIPCKEGFKYTLDTLPLTILDFKQVLHGPLFWHMTFENWQMLSCFSFAKLEDHGKSCLTSLYIFIY